jgi:hypothetical protein
MVTVSFSVRRTIEYTDFGRSFIRREKVSFIRCLHAGSPGQSNLRQKLDNIAASRLSTPTDLFPLLDRLRKPLNLTVFHAQWIENSEKNAIVSALGRLHLNCNQSHMSIIARIKTVLRCRIFFFFKRLKFEREKLVIGFPLWKIHAIFVQETHYVVKQSFFLNHCSWKEKKSCLVSQILHFLEECLFYFEKNLI